MPSGFDPTTTPGKMSTNVAVISAIVGASRVPLFVTKGGADFNPDVTWRAAEYDGRRHIAVGTEEIVNHGPSKMVATVVEFSNKVLDITLPGATSTTATGTTTTVPLSAGRALVEGDYIEAPWYELTLKDGTIVRIEFDFGIVTEAPTIDTKDKDEASMRITIESRVDPTKVGYSTDAPDYRRVVVAPAA